ncbi:DNA-binding protein [Lentzea sp. NBRC 102530]|nr:DNA-binding protein [Lentzea sp. NBRC 102530]
MPLTGRVISYDELRGFGFLAPDDGGEDVFVHVNDLTFDKRLVANGLRVEFVAAKGERGPKATQVSICDSRVSTEPALTTELTERLLVAIPTLTAQQLLEVRRTVVALARSAGWVRD